MEEEGMSSTILTKREPSDSNSSNSAPPRPTKRQRQHGISSSSSKYKGVVPQQNGNWGAQIYANHQRIWLGTFKTEAEAAAAYDSAAIKLRRPGGTSVDPHRNFPWTPLTFAFEPKFQAQYTIEQVLNMIKDGSYQTKLVEYLASMSQVGNSCQTSPNDTHQSGKKEGYFCQELFRKELTPSDVDSKGEHNMDWNFALGQNTGDQDGDDIELIFYDKSMRSWKFRYCYWKSSESYVFTRGWNKFVRDKDLKAKDIVTFYMCELRENNGKNVRKFCMIDIVARCHDQLGESPDDSGESQMNNGSRSEGRIVCRDVVQVDEEEKASLHGGEIAISNDKKAEKRIRLFGVDIC
ncbi:hypothetical protein Cgig2_027737 [Carnegiea gigantea]|uniref:Uncharacterized protein n=1 Tax=Carnegiea gigantea TaxID=171969 RepID=A0A9Q1JWM3_9CARY|nr:hypothetical protein Cgig2_027737 [Carnegiea gigantea]